jgi:hypothetical protein
MTFLVHLPHQIRATLAATALLATLLTTPAAKGATYNSPPDAIPDLLLGGDILNITGPASVQYIFTEPGSTINFLTGGGVFGALVKGTLNASPDAAGMGSGIIDGGTVNASGGLFAITSMTNGGTFNIDGATWEAANSSGGTINFRSGGLRSGVLTNTAANLYATTGPGELNLQSDSVANFFGGALTPSAGAGLRVGGEIHLFMKSAALSGQPIPGLVLGATVTIPERNVTLTGMMADNSAVDMNLDAISNPFPGKFAFFNGSVLRVTLVPEPAAAGLALVALLGSRFLRVSASAKNHVMTRAKRRV